MFFLLNLGPHSLGILIEWKQVDTATVGLIAVREAQRTD